MERKISFDNLKPDEVGALRMVAAYFAQALATEHDRLIIGEALNRAISRAEEASKMLDYKMIVFKPDTGKYYITEKVRIPRECEGPNLVNCIENDLIHLPYENMIRVLVPADDAFHSGYPRLISPRCNHG